MLQRDHNINSATVQSPPPAPAKALIEVARTSAHGLSDLIMTARRKNPLRELLLVSRVLGKHLPATPDVMKAAAQDLAGQIRQRITGDPVSVVALAETATGLGHLVAEALGAETYLHTTRRPSWRPTRHVLEPHSHAPDHALDLASIAELTDQVVLVDDEISTGTTMKALAQAVTIDRRASVTFAALVALEQPNGLDVAAISRYQVVERASDVRSTSGAIPRGQDRIRTRPNDARPSASLQRISSIRSNASETFRPSDREVLRSALTEIAGDLFDKLTGHQVLCVGAEEEIYPAYVVAQSLSARGLETWVQSSTRSPIVAAETVGYPIQSVIEVHGFDPVSRTYLYGIIESIATDIVIVASSAICSLLAGDIARVSSAAVHEVRL